ncbi:hypothetical protein AMTRI_Chr02g214340 [Amborella trichopoda]|uniref:EXPERA domain-containing protein n=1 Tax=Amborella trichopoda TaxID=13333 RepID=U5DGI6_AMBTC|nr:transmembrane protein 97 isoform X2 [Amborella trichopoda]ERN19523.1 hypothetical protein AMTR_s00062p00041640 [Amborella trichopoda]|eukprot:XP_006858056.1 transmembrane protein 97 isoform X2 [Amborella trichopoda]
MASCGLLVRVADAILLPFFALIAIAAPLVDAQTVLPSSLFPEFLADLKSQYATFSGDYLIAKKPPFFVGLVFYELIVQWPLSLANLYGLIASKPWFRTTCLAYGVSASTSMAAILGELLLSGQSSDKLLMIYLPFLFVSLIAIVRGLAPCSTIASTPVPARKKRA